MAKKKLNLRDAINKSESDDKQYAENAGKSGGAKDPREYKISKDSDDNGSVLIRFLPFIDLKEEQLRTMVTRLHHNFNHIVDKKKRWMDEDCLVMLGEDCPVCSAAWARYNTEKDLNGKESAKAFLAPTQKKKYFANILILEDDINPDNVGKVFYFSFGKQILDIMTKSAEPTADEIKEKGLEPFSIYDIYDSRPFRLKLTAPEKKGDYPHWKESYFATKSDGDVTDDLVKLAKSKSEKPDDIKDEEDALLEICHDLTEFSDGSRCLDADSLMQKFEHTLGETNSTSAPEKSGPAPTNNVGIEDDVDPNDEIDKAFKKEEEPKEEPKEEKVEEKKPEPKEEPKEEKKETPKEEAKPSGGTVDKDDFLASLGK